MKRFQPDIVTHCATLHLGEPHPGECVLTNLVAVRNVLGASASVGADQFMPVSSDKAASPVCVIGTGNGGAHHGRRRGSQARSCQVGCLPRARAGRGRLEKAPATRFQASTARGGRVADLPASDTFNARRAISVRMREKFMSGVAVVGREVTETVQCRAHFLVLRRCARFRAKSEANVHCLRRELPCKTRTVHWLAVRALCARKKRACIPKIQPEMTGLLVAEER